MGQLNIPNKASAAASTPPPPPPKLAGEDKKENFKFSINEKLKLILLGVCVIGLPTFGSYYFSRITYKKEIAELSNQINLLTNPSVKKLEEYEILLKNKLTLYSTEKENLAKDPVYQEVIKKTKELDNHIIICNVHLKNIEIVKQNKYKEVDSLIETLNKEIIK